MEVEHNPPSVPLLVVIVLVALYFWGIRQYAETAAARISLPYAVFAVYEDGEGMFSNLEMVDLQHLLWLSRSPYLPSEFLVLCFKCSVCVAVAVSLHSPGEGEGISRLFSLVVLAWLLVNGSLYGFGWSYGMLFDGEPAWWWYIIAGPVLLVSGLGMLFVLLFSFVLSVVAVLGNELTILGGECLTCIGVPPYYAAVVSSVPSCLAAYLYVDTKLLGG